MVAITWPCTGRSSNGEFLVLLQKSTLSIFHARWASKMMRSAGAPLASLPVVIFQFALSPYKDWQALAWTGALIITLAVLALSITARSLVSSRGQS